MVGKIKIMIGLAGVLIIGSCSNEDSPVIKAKNDSQAVTKPVDSGTNDQKASTDGQPEEKKTVSPLPNKFPARLTWDKDVNPVLSYRIYYTGATEANTGGTLMMTINAEPGKDVVNEASVGSFSIGSKACFYIVAANYNVVSLPSESACQTF